MSHLLNYRCLTWLKRKLSFKNNNKNYNYGRILTCKIKLKYYPIEPESVKDFTRINEIRSHISILLLQPHAKFPLSNNSNEKTPPITFFDTLFTLLVISVNIKFVIVPLIKIVSLISFNAFTFKDGPFEFNNKSPVKGLYTLRKRFPSEPTAT